MRALLLTLLTACAVTPQPTLRIDAVDELPEYETGLGVWSRLGVVPTFDECATCDVIIIERVIGLKEQTGADGLADQSTGRVLIDARWSDWALVSLVAHEGGHIILDTGRHTPPGERAVMAARGAEWDPQPADYVLACETIGVCL